MNRVLGTWRCPSGNRVEASISGAVDDKVRDVHLCWDRDPTPYDMVHYVARILPALTTRISEYTEKPGPSLVVLAL